MDEKDLERTLVKGIIGAGLIAALVAALAMPMTAQGQPSAAIDADQASAVDLSQGRP